MAQPVDLGQAGVGDARRRRRLNRRLWQQGLLGRRRGRLGGCRRRCCRRDRHGGCRRRRNDWRRRGRLQAAEDPSPCADQEDREHGDPEPSGGRASRRSMRAGSDVAARPAAHDQRILVDIGGRASRHGRLVVGVKRARPRRPAVMILRCLRRGDNPRSHAPPRRAADRPAGGRGRRRSRWPRAGDRRHCRRLPP